MKQKIVIRVTHCKKCRRKAMKIAASTDGVTSVVRDESDKDKLVVVGKDVDPAGLTLRLRKKVKDASLEEVNPEVKPPKKEEERKKEEKKNECNCSPCCYDIPRPVPPTKCELYQVVYSDPDPPNPCSIM